MSLFSESEAVVPRAIGRLNFTNPFTPERLALEQAITGRSHRSASGVWNMHTHTEADTKIIDEIARLGAFWADQFRARLDQCSAVTPEERDVYEPLVIYTLFEKYRPAMTARMLENPAETYYPVYRDFLADYTHYLLRPGRTLPGIYTPEKTFAIYFQIHRAFYHIFDFIGGGSLEAGELRSTIWRSIFTCDIARYHRALCGRMNAVTTLITGESGTGKELAARAVALSQYIPFDASSCRFSCAYPDCFQAVQLSAMPRTMIESELFGHRKGAYTGALADRAGYLEACLPWGSVFLDEIGEIDTETQVKLLRVLQNRTFRRLGDNDSLPFRGKIIAATNRDLKAAMLAGAFREDFYYRLCADSIETVPLRKLIGGDPAELSRFVRILTNRILGAEEAEPFTREAVRWIEKNLGSDYAWPGNVRELEQCVRNLLIRGSYTPMDARGTSPDESLSNALKSCRMTAEKLTETYLGVIYAREKNYVKTAAAAGLDRRTVKKILENSK